ncbi:hypothetical protein REPUB_Repub10bG0148000 [Reevesia pubescens]
MAFIANMVSMVLYFTIVMYFNISASTNILTNFLDAIFLLFLIGGFISDTFLSRFMTCLLFGFLEVLVRTYIFSKSNFSCKILYSIKLFFIISKPS